MARTALWVCLLTALAAPPGCRCSEPSPDRVGEDAQELGCRSACAAYFDAACGTRSASASDLAECRESCEKRSVLSSRAGCAPLRRAFLDCVSRATLSCDSVASAPGVALEQAEGALACRPALDALLACDAVCRDPGTVHLGERPERGTFVELVRNGCKGCPEKLAGGASVGSPCRAARVCEQHCCGCEVGAGSYLVRACVDEHCADRDVACRETPLVSGLRPCAP